MYKLIFADGSKIDCGLCGRSGKDMPLYIQVYNTTFVDCAQNFSDTSKTSVMIYDCTADQAMFEGYTVLTRLEAEDDYIHVTMTKG